MPLITVYSPKGGAGKTTLAANLCTAFASFGMKVLALDFDPQNSLRLHFGIPLDDERGFVAKSLDSNTSDWSKYILPCKNNIFVLPYGKVTNKQRIDFENRLINDELFLTRGLSALLEHPGLIIVADLPTGCSPSISDALFSFTDLGVIPFLADTASLALLPSVEGEHLFGCSAKHYFLLNQADYTKSVSRDTLSFMEERLQDRLLGVIHRDESVVEANAAQQAIIDFNPSSAAAFDIEEISKKIANIMNITVGNGTLHK